jgi:hypothetical protein
MIPFYEGRPEWNGTSDGESECWHSSYEVGELNPEDPVERRLAFGHETV